MGPALLGSGSAAIAATVTTRDGEATAILRARIGLGVVGVLWGLNWPAGKLALRDLTPWTYRAVGLGIATLVLMAFARATRRSLFVAPGWPRVQVVFAGLLNLAGYNILSAFAQLGTTTSRAAICAYTMPIWATLFARIVLGERLDLARGIALLAGACGLLVLLWPFVATGVPVGVLFALAAALSWASGTVFLKWVRLAADPIASATWQLASGTVAMVVGGLTTTGLHLGGLHGIAAAAVVYNALPGTALAYLLWFQAVGRLPASTAGLATLMVPVVGVGTSMLLLGDRLTVADGAGFGLIFIAAACALGAPARRVDRASPEPAIVPLQGVEPKF